MGILDDATSMAQSFMSSIGPNEAEAAKWPLSPETMEGVGKVIKSAGETLVESSASKRLVGTQIMDREIAGVFKGKGDRRIIRFTNGEEVPVDKSWVRELTREIGTRQYMSAIAGKSPEEALEQARRSLQYHQQRGNPWFTKPHKEEFIKSHNVMVENLGGGPPVEYVWVEAGPGQADRFYMPKVYADILERAGELKIPKGKK